MGYRNVLFSVTFYPLNSNFIFRSKWLFCSGKCFPALAEIRGAYDKFPDFFPMGTFIDHTHMKLRSNLLRLQGTSGTVSTTSGRPHGSPLV